MGELEQAVMADLWELDDEQWATVRQVHESLADRALAYTTVMTVMDRLARKEYVEQRREGRAYRYRPRVSRAGLTAELMRETLTDMDAAERGSALVSFVADAGPDDIAALRRALDDWPERRCRRADPPRAGRARAGAGEPRAPGAGPLGAAAAHAGAGDAAVAEHRARRGAGGAGRGPVAGDAPPVGGEVGRLDVLVAALAGCVTAVVAGRLLLSGHRTGTTLRRLRRRHREQVDLLARVDHEILRQGISVLDHEVPVAYCVPGMSGSRIVVSRSTLDPPRAGRARRGGGARALAPARPPRPGARGLHGAAPRVPALGVQRAPRTTRCRSSSRCSPTGPPYASATGARWRPRC